VERRRAENRSQRRATDDLDGDIAYVGPDENPSLNHGGDYAVKIQGVVAEHGGHNTPASV
jgi:hypothetical protein